MKAAGSSVLLAPIHQTIQCHIILYSPPWEPHITFAGIADHIGSVMNDPYFSNHGSYHMISYCDRAYSNSHISWSINADIFASFSLRQMASCASNHTDTWCLSEHLLVPSSLLQVLSHGRLIDDGDDSFWAWHEAPRVGWSKCGQLPRTPPCLVVTPLSCWCVSIISLHFGRRRRLIYRSCVLPVTWSNVTLCVRNHAVYWVYQNEYTNIWKSNYFTAN